jgi:hypothetical protein
VSAARPRLALAAALALCAAAAYHLAVTASTVLSFTLRHPLQDEFRMAWRYLAVPFPESVFLAENGHHPIVPGLVRWAQLEGLGGSQGLQIALAWLCAFVALGFIAREAWRAFRPQPLVAAAAAAIVFALPLWNANARLFIHAHEAAHVFYTTAGVVLALGAACAGRWILAIAGCLLATFSFGAGICAFIAVFAIAVLSRAGPRPMALVAGSAAATLIAYSALPGTHEVARMVPGPERIASALFYFLARLGSVFSEVTRHKAMVCVAASLVPIAMAGDIARRHVRSEALTRLEVLAAGLFVFGAMVNAAIAFGRADYFDAHPDQLFSERFLFWSCLMWTAMVLWTLARVRLGSAHAQAAVLALAAIALLAFIPPARRVHDWAGTRYREVELAAVVVRLGVRADDVVRRVVDHSPEEAYALGRVMRERRVGDFSGNPVTVPSGQPLAAFERRVAPESGPLGSHPRFWLRDAQGEVRGAAALVADPAPLNAFRIGLAHFDRAEGFAVAGASNVRLSE